jgi:WhiA C-terminal HTH domain/WhiA LAGLIDADG-like domain
VSGAERDLVLALRSELAAVEPARACDRHAEAAGLAAVSRRRGPSQDAPLARLLVRLGRDSRTAEESLAAFDWDAAQEHCRLAWLRGLFLARGSLSLSGGRTHLEFVVEATDAPILARRLTAISMPASWRVRRGRGVVTWKSGDTVGLFLRRIGATASLLELEARQVSRALRGDLNRVLNAESANLQRAVGAAGRQVAAIDELTATGELAAQPFVVRAVADARRETPEATLGELAERLQVHRSAVQRALERIERLAATVEDERPRRWASRRTAVAGSGRRTAVAGSARRTTIADAGPSDGADPLA